MGNPFNIPFPFSAPHGSQQLAQLNALDYWVASDFSDAGLTINRALADGASRYANGFRLYLPTDLYQIGTGIVAPGIDNVQIVSDGWGAQLVPMPSFTGYMLTVPQPSGGSGYRYGFVCRDLFFNCNSVAGVSGIDLQSTYYALLDGVRIRYCAGNAVFFDGTSAQFGAYTTLRKCTITDGVGATANGVYTNNYHEYVTLQDCNLSWYSTAGAVAASIKNTDNYRLENCVFDHNDTAVWLSFVTNSRITGCSFDRALTTFVRLTGTVNCTVEDNVFQDYVGVNGSPYMISVDGNSSNYRNLIRRNKAGHSTIAHWGTGQFAHEGNATGAAPNVYECNQTEGLPITGNANAVPTIRNNVGVNPVGHLSAQPAVPASGTAYTNVTGYDCTAYVTGGTVTAVAVGGTSTGLTSGPFRVPAGSTITLTYSVAPTWQWFGD